MADMVTKQELEAAKIDVKHAGEAVNTKKVITPRYGAPFKSLPLVAAEAQAKADEVVAQGFYKGYATEALLLAAKPDVSEMRARADDTRKIYRWNRTSAEGVTPVTGSWANTGLSELDLAKEDATAKANAAEANAKTEAKEYTDTSTTTLKENFIVEQSDEGIFFLTLDRVPLFYVLNDGSFHLLGDSTDLRDSVKNINKTNDSDFLFEFHDSLGQVIAFVDSFGMLNLAGDKSPVQTQIKESNALAILALKLQTISDANGRVILSKAALSVANDTTKKQLTTVEPFYSSAEGVQRIPAVLKLDGNKLLFFWGQGGDGEFVQMYKRIISYRTNGEILDVGTKELFRKTANVRGISKHPMLGRTLNGRIVLIFDERDSVVNALPYESHICFSDDEGGTFTTPVVIPKNPAFTQNVMGSTGTIVTLSTGRLVCPLYYTSPTGSIGMMYSDDDGLTWQYGQPLTISEGGLQEPSITVDENDKIYVSSRFPPGNLKHLSTSVDGGETLQNLGFNSDLISPPVASSIFYDCDNGLMLHSSPSGVLRDHYKIRVSGDKGLTWKVSYQPYTDRFFIGYTQIIKLSNNLYAVAVEGLTDIDLSFARENVGLFIFNTKEVFTNVDHN